MKKLIYCIVFLSSVLLADTSTVILDTDIVDGQLHRGLFGFYNGPFGYCDSSWNDDVFRIDGFPWTIKFMLIG